MNWDLDNGEAADGNVAAGNVAAGNVAAGNVAARSVVAGNRRGGNAYPGLEDSAPGDFKKGLKGADADGGLTPQTLASVDALIDAFGGTKKLSAILGIGSSAVSNYRKKGILPARHRATLAQMCRRQGLQVAADLFGDIRAASTNPFIAQGFTPLDMPILQPAAPFINLMGEEMRRRLYLFTDPRGEALCLRPDLTVPSALAYLDAHYFGKRAQFCYEGVAFRYQVRDAQKPQEFMQCGIEIIGGDNDSSAADDAHVLGLLLEAVRGSGVRDFEIHVNHLGLMPAFLNGLASHSAPRSALHMPTQARLRLLRDYKQGGNMQDALARLMQAQSGTYPADIMPEKGGDVEIAGRRLSEIRARLNTLNQAPAEQLTRAHADIIERFMSLQGSPDAVIAGARELAQQDNLLDYFSAYWRDLAGAIGVPMAALRLNVGQGRKMAYYTGFSFEVHVPALGAQSMVAAGGRYDNLLRDLGAGRDCPAIGGAYMRERVQAAAKLQAAKDATRNADSAKSFGD